MRFRRCLLVLLIGFLSCFLLSAQLAAAPKPKPKPKPRAGAARVVKPARQTRTRLVMPRPLKLKHAPKGAMAKSGVTTRERVVLMDLPPAARKTLSRQAGHDGSVDGIMKIVRDGKLSYSARITKNGRTRTVTVAGNGKLVKPKKVKHPKVKAPKRRPRGE